ncbi:MAG: hypothetical protein OEY29_14465 [Gammaproteobacteria bacterium]|nr:hypothetical protein [Gammaproteobacteria bacterium]
MSEKTDEEIKDEIREKVGEEEETPEFASVEEQAAAMGWREDGKNKFGQTVSAEQFIQEKPLYDTIGKLKSTLSRLDTQVLELQSDNKKIVTASLKEKENLLAQLAEAKEKALNDFEPDEVRKIDKQMETVREDIASTPKVNISPYYKAFLEENSWDEDPDDPRTMAALTIAGRFNQANPNASDKDLYDHVHKTIREKFPEKFEEKKPQQKVTAANKRSTTSSVKNKKITLADLDPEEARIVRNMMEMTGKTEEEYMKNYSTEALR